MLKKKTWFKVLCTFLLVVTLLLSLASGLFLELDERNHWSDGLYSFPQSDLAGTWMEKLLSRTTSHVVNTMPAISQTFIMRQPSLRWRW